MALALIILAAAFGAGVFAAVRYLPPIGADRVSELAGFVVAGLTGAAFSAGR